MPLESLGKIGPNRPIASIIRPVLASRPASDPMAKKPKVTKKVARSKVPPPKGKPAKKAPSRRSAKPAAKSTGRSAAAEPAEGRFFVGLPDAEVSISTTPPLGGSWVEAASLADARERAIDHVLQLIESLEARLDELKAERSAERI